MLSLSSIVDLKEQLLYDSFLMSKVLSLKHSEQYLYTPFQNPNLSIHLNKYSDCVAINLYLTDGNSTSSYYITIQNEDLFKYKAQRILE